MEIQVYWSPLTDLEMGYCIFTQFLLYVDILLKVEELVWLSKYQSMKSKPSQNSSCFCCCCSFSSMSQGHLWVPEVKFYQIF